MGVLEESIKNDFVHSFNRHTSTFDARSLLDNIDILVSWYHGYTFEQTAELVSKGDIGFFTHPETGQYLFQLDKTYRLENPRNGTSMSAVYEHNAKCSRMFLQHSVYSTENGMLLHRANDSDDFSLKLIADPISVAILTKIAKAICQRYSAYKPIEYLDCSLWSVCYDVLREFFPEVIAQYQQSPVNEQIGIPDELTNDVVFERIAFVYRSLAKFYHGAHWASSDITNNDIIVTHYYRGYLFKINLGDYRIFEWSLLNLLSGRRSGDLRFKSMVTQTPTATITHEIMEFLLNVAISESILNAREKII